MRPLAAARAAPRSPSASPGTPRLHGRFRESPGLGDQTPPRSPGLSRPLPPSPPASLRSPSSPSEPLSLPGPLAHPRPGGARGGCAGIVGGPGGARGGPGRLGALRGRVVPEGVRAVGGCGEGALGGGGGSERPAKGRKCGRLWIRGSGGPVEGSGGECEPQGWGEGFGPRRKERRSGTRVPGASACCGWHLEEPWTGGRGGGKGPNTLGWITVRPGLARLRVGRGSGGPSRKGGVDRGSAGRSGCTGLCEVTAGGGVGLLGRARQRKACVCLGDSALSAGIGDRGGGWVWGKW